MVSIAVLVEEAAARDIGMAFGASRAVTSIHYDPIIGGDPIPCDKKHANGVNCRRSKRSNHYNRGCTKAKHCGTDPRDGLSPDKKWSA
ncbi:hypothetical protein AMTRI_Chr06g191960 [Amborella trichopoda]